MQYGLSILVLLRCLSHLGDDLQLLHPPCRLDLREGDADHSILATALDSILVEVAGQTDESALRSMADFAAVPSRVGHTGSVLAAIPL